MTTTQTPKFDFFELGLQVAYGAIETAWEESREEMVTLSLELDAEIPEDLTTEEFARALAEFRNGLQAAMDAVDAIMPGRD